MPFLAGFITPQDYGAVGNGTTDDTAALQAALNAAYVTGTTLFLPPAVYAVTPVSSTSAALTLNNGVTGFSSVRIIGAATGTTPVSTTIGTAIRKLANGPIFAMAGPATDTTGNTHCKYIDIENVELDGNTFTGTMIQCYYADNLNFTNVRFINNYDIVIDSAEFWDSRFYNCVWENSGSLTNLASTPNVLLRNSAAASGFGTSTDNVNAIHFVGCRWEAFRQGAVWIQQGVSSTNNPNGIFLTNSKMESSVIRGGPHFSVDSSSRGVYVHDLYCYSGGFGGTYSTATDVITWSPNGASALTNVFIADRAATSTIANGVTVSSNVAGQSAVLRNVVGLYNTAPTGAHINFSTATGTFVIDNCVSTLGTQFANAPASVAGAVVNSSSSAGALSVTNATAVAGALNADILAVEATAASLAFGIHVTGDTNNRLQSDGSGNFAWGSGAGAVDTTLGRNTAGVLQTGQSFRAVNNIVANQNLRAGSASGLGSGLVGGIEIANVTTLPTGNPSGGAVAYARTGTPWARDPNGVISPMISPSEFSASPTGCLGETFPRCLGSSATATQTIGATTGTVYMMGVWLPAGLTITNVNWITGTTAAGTPTHWWLGIANSAGLQQATTADQTTGAIAANTLITKALTATYTTTATGLYYLLLSVTATTNPTATGLPVPIANINLATPILAGVSATTQSAPGTNGTTTYTAPASAGGIPYMYLT